jgi:hypothetical protein
MTTVAQHPQMTERLCRWIGHGEHFWRSQTTLSRTLQDGRLASLRLIMATRLRRVRCVRLGRSSRPRRPKRSPNLIIPGFPILHTGRVERCLRNLRYGLNQLHLWRHSLSK